MGYRSRISLSLAALSMALFLPELTHAQSTTTTQNQQPTTTMQNAQSPTSNNSWQNSSKTSMAQTGSTSQYGRQEAKQMVAARAYLLNKLDANDMKPGADFRAKLADDVQLKNGPKLGKGTELIGKIGTDDLNIQGTSKLALCINQARLKNGKTIPVKATIVGVYGPESQNTQGYYIAPGQEQPNDWTPSIVRIDQINAVGGVDLHSRIAGQNSGVFVSTKKDDVKLAAGSELALAIAEGENSNGTSASSSGGM